MKNTNDEIIRLLKHGRSDEVRSYVNAQKKEHYPEDFSIFMEQMLNEYHIKRKDVAIRSGLSQDYTYKLLRGAKKTTERDYIIAICIAVGLNISQTQHALSIYGMPMLNRADLRSNVIYMAIENHLDIDGVNQWLEKSGFVYIKTSPDMPSADIEIRGEKPIEETSLKVNHQYEEIERHIEAEHVGNAPMDYNYWGIITVRDENGKKFYVEAAYSVEGDNLIVLDEENYIKSNEWMSGNCKAERDFFSLHPELDNDIEKLYERQELLEEFMEMHTDDSDVKVLEQYDSLVDAGESLFFKYFLELDQATDEKVIETMSYIDDTRNYGMRIGAGIMGGQKICYLEAFNTSNPAEREYLQVVQKDGECTYTASHESYFMRIELGEMYSAYFGEKREPEYYINIQDTSEIGGRNLRLKFIFDDLKLKMHQYTTKTFGPLFNSDMEKISEEMISSLIQRATWLMHSNDLEESLELLIESVNLMHEEEKKGVDYTISLIITYSKIAITYGNMGNIKALFDTYEKVYQMKNRIPQILESNSAGEEDAILAIAESMIHKAQLCQNMRGQYDSKAKEVIKEAIELLEGRCTYEGSWTTLFMAYTKYAYMIDVDKPGEAVKYCRKAVAIVNAYHLEQNSQQRDLVVTLYNNYAWVLWNKLESEEAIIYYGRAIELLESFLLLKDQDSDMTKATLKHEGEALYKLYIATNKEKEAAHLIERLKESGVEIL